MAPSWAFAMNGGVFAQSVILPAGFYEVMDMQHWTKQWNILGKVVLFSAGLAVAIVYIVVFIVTRD